MAPVWLHAIPFKLPSLPTVKILTVLRLHPTTIFYTNFDCPIDRSLDGRAYMSDN
jgi:hypothetical protein